MTSPLRETAIAVRHGRSAPVVIELLLLGQLSRRKGFTIATPYLTGLPFQSFVVEGRSASAVVTHQSPSVTSISAVSWGELLSDQNLQTCEV
jgi:hypothetical protein